MKFRKSEIYIGICVLISFSQLIMGDEMKAIWGLLFLILIALLAILDIQIYK